MKAIVKIITGSIARHWLGAILALVAVRIGIHPDDSAAAVASLSNEVVYNALVALCAAIVPVIWSVSTRLRAKLKQRLSLLLPALTTEGEVKEIIAEAPLSARISATFTADPEKILNAPTVPTNV